MSSEDKLNALFEEAVAGQDRLKKEEESAGEVPIELDADPLSDEAEEEVFAPEESGAADEVIEAAIPEEQPDKKPKTANEVVTEALIKAKQEALDALEQTQKEAKDMHQQLLRKTADFDNFRKRSRKQQEDAVRFSREELLREFLPVIDNFERALEHVGDKSDDPIVQGVSMVKQQLDATFAKLGATPIEAIGQAFDPKFHEAVERQETDEVQAGAICREYQKGYMLNGNLLRPAMVVVAVAPPADDDSADSAAAASAAESKNSDEA